MVLATAVHRDRLAVLVMKRWPRGPSPAPVAVEVRDGDRVLCEATGEVAEWSALNDQLKELAEQGRARRTSAGCSGAASRPTRVAASPSST